MTLIATQRDGLIVVYSREADGELRQRVAIDAGIDEPHQELAELADGLARRYGWDGATQLAKEPPKPKPAAVELESAREHKRAYNRDYYRRNRSKAAVAPGAAQKPKRTRRTTAQMEAFRADILAALATRPGASLAELAEVVDVGPGETRRPPEVIRAALEPLIGGAVRRTTDEGGIYRYTATRPPAQELAEPLGAAEG